MSLYDSFAQKMVLKGQIFGDNGKGFALHIHCIGLSGDRAVRVSVLALQD